MNHQIRPGWTALLQTAAWLAFFWGPFHYALRTRFYFEGATVFDIIMFLACLLAPVFLLVLFRNHPVIMFIAGTFCAGIFAYASLFIMPIMNFWNTTTLITIAPGIQTQVGQVPMCLLIASSMLGMGGFLQIKAYEHATSSTGEIMSLRGMTRDVLPFGAAPLLYWLSMLVFPQNSNVSLVIICIASAFMIAVEAIFFKPLIAEWAFPGIATFNTRSMPDVKIQALRGFLLWIAWAVFSVVIFFGVVLYFVINVNYPQYVLIGAFLLDCAIGAGIVAALSIGFHWVPVIQHFLPLAACLLLLWQYETWIQADSLPMVNPVTGTVVIIFIWTFFRLFTLHSRGNATGVRGGGIIGLMITWLVVAYAAFIPMHPSDISSLQPVMIPLLLIAGGLAVVCGLLFHFFIPLERMGVEPMRQPEGGILDAAP
ncbi:MAG TPA: hypothetical protein VKM55_04785 [Candidatus Lokiarchaeia archaeon]|nr:hypothetical protein [Candidatus Lokiarchaeia archaeon]